MSRKPREVPDIVWGTYKLQTWESMRVLGHEVAGPGLGFIVLYATKEEAQAADPTGELCCFQRVKPG